MLVVIHRLRPSVRDQTDPPGLRDQVVVLFDEWARLSEDQPANQMHDKFVLKLQTAGFLKVPRNALVVHVLCRLPLQRSTARAIDQRDWADRQRHAAIRVRPYNSAVCRPF